MLLRISHPRQNSRHMQSRLASDRLSSAFLREKRRRLRANQDQASCQHSRFMQCHLSTRMRWRELWTGSTVFRTQGECRWSLKDLKGSIPRCFSSRPRDWHSRESLAHRGVTLICENTPFPFPSVRASHAAVRFPATSKAHCVHSPNKNTTNGENLPPAQNARKSLGK